MKQDIVRQSRKDLCAHTRNLGPLVSWLWFCPPGTVQAFCGIHLPVRVCAAVLEKGRLCVWRLVIRHTHILSSFKKKVKKVLQQVGPFFCYLENKEMLRDSSSKTRSNGSRLMWMGFQINVTHEPKLQDFKHFHSVSVVTLRQLRRQPAEACTQDTPRQTMKEKNQQQLASVLLETSLQIRT